MRCTETNRAILVVGVVALLAVAGIGGQTDDQYVVGPRDVLGITLFNQTDLSGKYTIQADGTFTFPLIGAVKVAGLTVQQVASELRTRLRQGFFRDPQLAVSVDDYRSQHVYVMGHVREPGSYPWTGGMTLLDALARAGAPTSDASSEAMIVRGARGQPVPAVAASALEGSNVIRVNLNDLQSGAIAPNVSIEPGDTIFVPRAETIFVSGQVRSPGAYPMTHNMTALQAIAIAGGVTERGATNRLRILRTVGDTRREMKVKLTDVLSPGDTLIVPERYF